MIHLYENHLGGYYIMMVGKKVSAISITDEEG